MTEDRYCEAIVGEFVYGPYGPRRCYRTAVGEAIDATSGTIHAVCAEHLPRERKDQP